MACAGGRTSDRRAGETRFAGKKASVDRYMQSRLCALQTSTTRHPVQHCPAQMRVGCGERKKERAGHAHATAERIDTHSEHVPAVASRVGISVAERQRDERAGVCAAQNWDSERLREGRACKSRVPGIGRYLIRLDTTVAADPLRPCLSLLCSALSLCSVHSIALVFGPLRRSFLDDCTS